MCLSQKNLVGLVKYELYYIGYMLLIHLNGSVAFRGSSVAPTSLEITTPLYYTKTSKTNIFFFLSNSVT